MHKRKHHQSARALNSNSEGKLDRNLTSQILAELFDPAHPRDRQASTDFEKEIEKALGQRLGFFTRSSSIAAAGTSLSHREQTTDQPGRKTPEPSPGLTLYDRYLESMAESVKVSLDGCRAAGCLPFNASGGSLWLLMQNESMTRHREVLADFGGKTKGPQRKRGDKARVHETILHCAAREFAEETYGLFGSRSSLNFSGLDHPEEDSTLLCSYCGASAEGEGLDIDSLSSFNPSQCRSEMNRVGSTSTPEEQSGAARVGFGGGITSPTRLAAFSTSPLQLSDFCCSRGVVGLESGGWSANVANTQEGVDAASRSSTFSSMQCYRQRVRDSANFAEELIIRRGGQPVVNTQGHYAVYFLPIPKLSEERLDEASAIVDGGQRTFRWVDASQISRKDVHPRLRTHFFFRELSRMQSLARLAAFAKRL